MRLWQAKNTFWIGQFDNWSPEDDFSKILKGEILGEYENSVATLIKLRTIPEAIPTDAYPLLTLIGTIPDPASPIGEGVDVKDETSSYAAANKLAFSGDVTVTPISAGEFDVHITGGGVVQDTYMITQPILSIDSGLDAFHTAGSWKYDSTNYSIAEGTYTLLDEKTDWYVYVQGDNLLHTAATVPAGTIGIAKYTTTGGSITSLENLGALAIQAHVDNLAAKVGEDDATPKTPTTPEYSNNNFVVDGDTHNEAISRLDQILGVIAPAKAGALTGTGLTVSNTTRYNAILPTGLNAIWYNGGGSAGSTINGYVVDGIYNLTSPDSSTRFRCGIFGETGTYGTLTHVLDAVDGSAHDMTTGTGTTGTVTCNSIVAYNSLWAKGNGYITYNHATEGWKSHALKHTEAGTSNTINFWFDDVASAPSFSVNPSVAENTVVDKYLSSVAYYGNGTTLDVSYTAASGIFRKAYHPINVSRIECIGASNLAVNPGATPNLNDAFAVTNQTINLNVANQATQTKNLTVRLFKPDGQTTSQTAVISRAICTYGTVSTQTIEYFYDEFERLVLSDMSVWDSQNSFRTTLGGGDAQVRNGTLQYPVSADYSGSPSFTGDQEYNRRFYKATANSGTIVFTGINYTDIDSYNTGDLNILLYLETEDVWFDLGRVYGDNNGNGSGDSRANSKGARTSGSGTSLDFTFGTYSTANNSGRYRFIVIFRNNNHSISQIVTS